MVRQEGSPNTNLFTQLPLRKQLVFTLIFNTLIALGVSVVLSNTLLNAFVYAQTIGLTMFATVHVYFHLFSFRPVLIIAPLVIGSLFGLALAILVSNWINGSDMADVYQVIVTTPGKLLPSLVLALGFGSLAVYFTLNRIMANAARSAVQNERLKRVESEKQLAEAQLRLLQAQVEPHFLFNTLSNIGALITSDPIKGRKLLDDLTQYLRATLSHSRNVRATLGQEIDILEHYLAIQQVRMGERLRYRITVPQALRSRPLAPMLLQPLVENAIKHGIEPAEHGGEIGIDAESIDGIMRINITDTGLGLQTNAGSGFGIANIRERLHTLYSDAAQLEVREFQPHGVSAVLEVPDA